MEEHLEEEAFKIVNDALSQAINQLALERQCYTSVAQSAIFGDEEVLAPNIKWAKCEDFTPQLGIELIDRFISTWKRDTAWLHCIDYIGVEELDYDFNHKYRVRWSIPTRRKPIPRATACVYFSLYVSKIKPKELPVQVFYVFEGTRLIHRPGKSRFREIWLKNIIESKVLTLEQICF